MKHSLARKIFIIGALFSSGTALAEGETFSLLNAASIFLLSASYLLGLILVGTGVLLWKKVSANPQQYTLKNSFFTIAAGVLLLMSGWFYSVSMNSVTTGDWSNSTYLAIDKNLALPESNSLSLGVFNIPKQTVLEFYALLYLFGLFSFLKGSYLISDIGAMESGSEKRGTVKRVFTHIGGGMFLMNIGAASCWIMSKMNLSLTC